jgi:hypothetical protein
MTMNLSLRTEGTAEVQRALAALGPDAKKASTLWVNWIGLEAQGEMRAALPQRFTLRGTADLFRKAVVFQQATNSGARQRQAILRVGSDGPGGTKASATKNLGNILARHEDAETRTDTKQVYRTSKGGIVKGGFFLPANGMRTSSSNPPRSMYPTSIGAQIRSDPSGRVYFASGNQKGSRKKGNGSSFFVTDKGIFRRRHTSFGGRVDVEAVWWFTKTVRTPARLGLWITAEKVFETRAVALGMQAIDETIFRRTL